MGQRTRVYVRPGDRVRLEIPFSEVCMHMQVSGKVMDVELVASPYGYAPSAQLYDLEGRPFSAPITYGEAGIYGNAREGMYCFPLKARS